jgi:hypothetical protein
MIVDDYCDFNIGRFCQSKPDPGDAPPGLIFNILE